MKKRFIKFLVLAIAVFLCILLLAPSVAFAQDNVNKLPGSSNSVRIYPPSTEDILVNLSWGNAADLDLHIVEPSGEEIYYGNKISATGGTLDIDENGGIVTNSISPQENIFWESGAAPHGQYRTWVHYYDSHEGSGATYYELTIKVRDQVVHTSTGTLNYNENSGYVYFDFELGWGDILLQGTEWNGVNVYYNGTDYSYSGGSNYSNDGKNIYLGEKWQCVELVRRFCYEKDLGYLPKIGSPPDAYRIWQIIESDPGSNFYTISNGDRRTPQFGDILVFNKGSGSWSSGHVAVVKEVSGGRVYFVQQNAGTNALDSLPINNNYIGTEQRYPNVLGWIRSGTTDINNLLKAAMDNLISKDASPQSTNVNLINPGTTSQAFDYVNNIISRLLFFLNWGGSSLKLSAYKPDGSLYSEIESGTPPIIIEVNNADIGT